MCYSGKCKYEFSDGDCSLIFQNRPDDALCVISELEILRHQMREAKNNFQYLVVEANYRDEIMEKLKADSENGDCTEEEFEMGLFIVLNRMLNGGEVWGASTDTKLSNNILMDYSI